jgi:RHS repeat-associated protein
VGGEPLGYDINGNLASHNGWTYTYDAQNRLTSASSAQSVVQMSYDGRNRCVSRTVNGTTTFLFYESWNLVEERDGSGTQTARYVHGAQIDELLTLTTQPSTLNQAYYYHHDGLGSVARISDAVGTTAEKYAYDVYGKSTICTPQNVFLSASSVGNRFLFTGRENLGNPGVYDYRNRVYSMIIGRFQQMDPMKLKGGHINILRYAANAPSRFVDPSGLIIEIPAETGVKSCYTWIHAYIPLDSEAWGFYPRTGGDTSDGWIPGAVLDDSDLGGFCLDEKLLKCKYDIEKFKMSVRSAAERDRQSPPQYHAVFFNCTGWQVGVLSGCREFAKKD